jgi:hypothetical protein
VRCCGRGLVSLVTVCCVKLGSSAVSCERKLVSNSNSGLCETTCVLWGMTLLALNVCSGNLWLLDWVFAGMILSFLKLRHGAFLVHSVDLERIWIGLCAQRILRLYSYAMHKSTDQLIHFVLRWAFCACFVETVGDAYACHLYSEALGITCVANRYNNTPKDFIVNLFCLIIGTASFRSVRLLYQCCRMGKLWH